MTNTELTEALEASDVQKQYLAAECKVSPTLVSLWLKGTRRILPRYVPIIERVTKKAAASNSGPKHQTLEV